MKSPLSRYLTVTLALAACEGVAPGAADSGATAGGGTAGAGGGGAATAGGASSSSGGSAGGASGGGSSALRARCTAGPDAEKAGWRLAWCDEFDGADLDERNWSFDLSDGAFLPSGPGWGNQEKEFYTARAVNARVESGRLKITALKDGPHHANGPAYPSTYDFSSARLKTKGKVDFTYGRVEVRAKLPRGQGVWPAIWLLPTDEAYGGWASSGEIDLMELKGQQSDVVHGTLHFGQMWNQNEWVSCQLTRAAGSYSDGFHTYALEWSAESIRWFVDDKLFATQAPRGGMKPTSTCLNESGGAMTPTMNEHVTDPTAGWYSAVADPPAPFDRNFHLILNVAVGGGFVGAVDPAVFPQSMEVEFVRLYQR
ncbi:MAG: glycoside hydrolase family 16 protein [Archangiaceae bacterium]|nr:glycoside hydrolase family 16 protein [Archangiaceae bacterium]